MLEQALALSVAAAQADEDEIGESGGGGGELWAEQLERLALMGFEGAQAAEMLALCEGDLEATVQLLCG